MKEALVSIIIPIYNCEDLISDCIESVIAQTYKNIEIILVDDGSSDSSYKVCEHLVCKDSRIKLFTKKNGGPSSARNLGLKNAEGEYVAFVDSDDVIDREYISKLYNLLISEDADISSCGYDTTLPNKEVVPCEQFKKEIYGPHLGDIDEVHYPYTVWHLLFRRNLLKTIEFDEGIFYLEDMKFVDQVFMNCNRVVGNSEILYHRIAHEESLTEKRYKKENFPRYFTLIKALEDMCVISKECNKLHKQRLTTLIKECVIMREFMKKKHITDIGRAAYLDSSIRKHYAQLKKHNMSGRESGIMWLCVHIPGFYCKLKHISFNETNNSIA